MEGPFAVRIERINALSSRLTILAWPIGLIYYNWFAPNALHLPPLAVAPLGLVGMFLTCVLFGGGMALFAALMTKIETGNAQGRCMWFQVAAIASPACAFLAAQPALDYVSVLLD